MRVTTSTDTGFVVFTDLVGFTQLTAERGDEFALSLLERQDRIVRDALVEGARVVKELGDGLLLWFSEETAALDICLGLQARFCAASTEEVPLWVRMGMHWGRPRSRGDDLVGHDVNLAARIVDVAGPGEVLVSEPALARLGLLDGSLQDAAPGGPRARHVRGAGSGVRQGHRRPGPALPCGGCLLNGGREPPGCSPAPEASGSVAASAPPACLRRP